MCKPILIRLPPHMKPDTGIEQLQQRVTKALSRFGRRHVSVHSLDLAQSQYGCQMRIGQSLQHQAFPPPPRLLGHPACGPFDELKLLRTQ